NVKLQLHAVARPHLFPSVDPTSARPLIVVNRNLLLSSKISAGVQLWSASASPLPSDLVAALKIDPTSVRRPTVTSVRGALTVAHALSTARFLALVTAVVAAVTILAATRATKTSRGQREDALLEMLGLGRGRIAVVAGLGAAVTGALAVLAGSVGAAATN